MTDRRCGYCGRTQELLVLLNPGKMSLCPCCDHCEECSRLVLAHQNPSEMTKPSSQSEKTKILEEWNIFNK